MTLFRPPRADPDALAALLAEARRRLGAGEPAAASRLFRQVVADADRLARSGGPATVAVARAEALLELGKLAWYARPQRLAEALDAFRAAARVFTPPVWICRVLARDVVRRGDQTAEALTILATYCAIRDLAADDPVLSYVQRLCYPGAQAGDAEQERAAAVAGYVVAAAPWLEWAQFGRGYALLKLRRLPEAVAALTAAEELPARRAQSSYLVGTIHREAGREEEAYQAFRRALEVDPGHVAALLSVADIDIARAARDREGHAAVQLARALDAIQTASGIAPDRPDVYYRLVHCHGERGRLLVERGDLRAALAPFREARRLAPTDATIAVSLGRLLVDLGEQAEAQVILAAVVRRDPRDPSARYELGRCLFAARRFAEAADVLGLLPAGRAHESALLGRALAGAGRFEAALDVLAPLLDGETTDHEVAMTVGCIHANRQAWSEAAAAFERARTIAARRRRSIPDLDLFAGVATHRAGDPARTGELLERARATDEDDPRVHVELGRLALDAGQVRTATVEFRAAAALAADSAEAAFGLAAALDLAGDPAAVREYERALRLRPDWQAARLRLEALQPGSPDGPGGPDDSRVHYLRGLTALRDGRPEAAVDLLTPLAGPVHIDYHLAVAAAATGDEDGAARRLEGHDGGAVTWLAGLLAARNGSRAEALAAFRAVLDDASSVPEARRHLTLLKAVTAEESGRPDGALLEWEECLREQPLDLEILHRVGILAYRRLQEAGADRSRAVDRLVIACWGTLLYTDAFWTGVAEHTGRPVPDADRRAVRERFAADVARLLRDRNERDGPRLDLDWGLERRAAEAVGEFTAQREVAGWPRGVACGPLMLARAADAGAALRSALDAETDPGAERAGLLLGPLARGSHLLEEGLLPDAIAELEPHVSGSSRAAELYRDALVRLAFEEAEESRWGPAVASFVRAHEAGADVRRHAPLIRTAALASMRTLTKGDGGYTRVAEMLESVLLLVPADPAIVPELAASYVELARQAINGGDHPEAARLLDRSLRLSPDDPYVRQAADLAASHIGTRSRVPRRKP